jgi:hypothetical protein
MRVVMEMMKIGNAFRHVRVYLKHISAVIASRAWRRTVFRIPLTLKNSSWRPLKQTACPFQHTPLIIAYPFI